MTTEKTVVIVLIFSILLACGIVYYLTGQGDSYKVSTKNQTYGYEKISEEPATDNKPMTYKK